MGRPVPRRASWPASQYTFYMRQAMTDHFLNYLKREHARLERELRATAASVFPDQVQLQRLKKLKLAVKHQIVSIEKERQVDQAA
jgi:hypothetical protein